MKDDKSHPKKQKKTLLPPPIAVTKTPHHSTMAREEKANARAAFERLKNDKNSVEYAAAPQELVEYLDQCDDLRKSHPDVSERQADLVHVIVYKGGSVKAAADVIGANDQWAYAALRKEAVVEYRNAVVENLLGWKASQSVSRVAELASNARSEMVKLQANQDLMDRAGLKKDGVVGVAVQINIDV